MAVRPPRFPRPVGAPRRLADLRPSGAVVAATIALALAVAAGWWLGGASREPAPAPSSASVVALGGFQLELESAWVRADAAPGLPVEGAEVFAQAPGLAARSILVAGPAADASLIPEALRGELPAELGTPRRATLAGLPAWRYGPLEDGSRTLEVTVAPTTGDALALVCWAPGASWSAWLDCGNGVLGVSTGSAQALAPAPDLAFRQAAGPILEALDGRRVDAREQLSQARRPAPALALALAHEEAARALDRYSAPGVGADVVSALRRSARAYETLAATTRDRERFIAARRAVTRADAALTAALAELRG